MIIMNIEIDCTIYKKQLCNDINKLKKTYLQLLQYCPNTIRLAYSPEKGAPSLPQKPFLTPIRLSQQLRFRTVKIIYDVYISKVCQLFQAIKPT
jgi:hypothetical protein